MRARETIFAARWNTHGDVSGTKAAASLPPPAVVSRENIEACNILSPRMSTDIMSTLPPCRRSRPTPPIRALSDEAIKVSPCGSRAAVCGPAGYCCAVACPPPPSAHDETRNVPWEAARTHEMGVRIGAKAARSINKGSLP